MLKELGKGDWSINEIRKHFAFLKEHGGRTFGMYPKVNEKIASRYAKKMVLSKYYAPIKFLTDEEFKAGKPGYVLGNFRTELTTPKI